MQDFIMGFTVMNYQGKANFFCQNNLSGIMFKLDILGSMLFNKIKTNLTIGDNLITMTKLFKF
jgi:hypothetical protein